MVSRRLPPVDWRTGLTGLAGQPKLGAGLAGQAGLRPAGSAPASPACGRLARGPDPRINSRNSANSLREQVRN